MPMASGTMGAPRRSLCSFTTMGQPVRFHVSPVRNPTGTLAKSATMISLLMLQWASIMSQDKPRHAAWWHAQERIEEINKSLKGYHQGPIEQGARIMDNQFYHPAYMV